jgi:hypothetical protein
MQIHRARPKHAERALQLHAKATEKLFFNSKEKKPKVD